MDEERGTGRTTAQMREAPRDAIYVWCNGAVGYAMSLAKALGRGDLRVLGPESALAPDRLRGVVTPVVVDHAALLTEQQAYELERWRERQPPAEIRG